MVVVVGGVMTTQGDGKAVHKAKDHSRDASRIENGFRVMLIVNLDPGGARWRAGCVERRSSGSGRASSRPPVRKNKYGAMILLHRAKSNSADIDLRDRVEQQLDWEPEVTSTKIGVGAEDGVVTLTGFVNTYAEKIAAERVVKRTYGVKAIANDIEVKPLFKKTDTEIATRAVSALESRVDVPDEKIKVIVKDGWVTLDGNVDWYYQKNAAEFAVKYLQGVKGVTDDIKLKPQVSTTEVKSKIEEALKRNAEVDARRITVSGSDGKVTLWGNVRSWMEKDEAENAAWAAPGVTQVKSNISVVP